MIILAALCTLLSLLAVGVSIVSVTIYGAATWMVTTPVLAFLQFIKFISGKGN